MFLPLWKLIHKYFNTKQLRSRYKIRLFIQFFLFVVISTKSFCQSDSVHVGFALAHLYDERWWHDKDYFKEKFNELGGKVSFIDCKDSPERQEEAIDDFIEMGVDCIVIVAVNSRTAHTIVEKSVSAGIPIVAYDRLILDAKLDLYVTANSVTVGEMMAKQVVENLKEGNILFVGGPKSDFNSCLVAKGVFSVLDNYKEEYQVYSRETVDWVELSSFMIIQDFIQEKDCVPDAIICANDALTYGAIMAIEACGKLGDVLLTGQDAELNICRQIVNDNVLMTVYKSNKLLAFQTAEAVMNIVKRGDVTFKDSLNNNYTEVPTLFIEPIMITKNNIGEIVNLGVYSEEELYESVK